MNKLLMIKFLKYWNRYSEGDEALFQVEESDWLASKPASWFLTLDPLILLVLLKEKISSLH